MVLLTGLHQCCGLLKITNDIRQIEKIGALLPKSFAAGIRLRLPCATAGGVKKQQQFWMYRKEGRKKF